MINGDSFTKPHYGLHSGIHKAAGPHYLGTINVCVNNLIQDQRGTLSDQLALKKYLEPCCLKMTDILLLMLNARHGHVQYYHEKHVLDLFTNCLIVFPVFGEEVTS